jgi:hypothetical protein
VVVDKKRRGNLRFAQIIQISYLVAVSIWVAIPIITPYIDLPPVFTDDDPILDTFIVILSLAAVANLVLTGPLAQWLTKRKQRKPQSQNELYSIWYFRSFLYAGIGIYGLVLGILGASWPVVLPFFFVAAGALILTFPTEKRWKRM